MRWPRPRFTLRRLMAMVAIVAFELALGSFLYDEARRAVTRATVPWVETGVELAFLNLLIGGPVWVFLREIEPQNGPKGRRL